MILTPGVILHVYDASNQRQKHQSFDHILFNDDDGGVKISNWKQIENASYSRSGN